MDAQVLKRRFSVDEFHQMAEAGIFGDGDRVELLAGEVVEMTPIGSRHAACVRRLIARLSLAVGQKAIVDVQNPLYLGEHSEPQPDLTLLQPRPDYYQGSHPGPGDVLLVIEVADTSAEYDREVKVPLYARAGVPEVWVLDLGPGVADVYRQPALEGYREHRRLGTADTLTAAQIPALQIAVSGVIS